MKLQGSNIILEHIEKLILVLAAIVGFWLLFSKVITSPNNVEYNGKKYAPGSIDGVIKQKAQIVQDNINSDPTEKKPYGKISDKFISEFKSPVKVDTSIWPAMPSYTSGKIDKGQRYAIPSGPQISDISAKHIRAVAYIPAEEVTFEKPYSEVETEPNDFDIVTVEAKVDVQKLHEAFEEAFMGPSVRLDWQDPCLAEPVFAAVHLQRSEKLPNGQWGGYTDIGRVKTDNMAKLLSIIENVSDLPRGGLEVRLLQYNNAAVQSNLLQPMAYDIASAEEDWFPPSFHKEFSERLTQQEEEQRRQEMEERRAEREAELEEARSRRREGRTRESSRSSTRDTGGEGGMMGGMGGGMMGVGGGGRTTERPTRRERNRDGERERRREERRREIEERRRERGEDAEKEDDKSVNALYKQFEEILIDDEMELEKMTEPLLFWAHDDTVEAGKTYRYKMRLGVFNPVSGTRKINAEFESYKDQVILWSDVLETEEITVPEKLYFFAKDIQEAANTVKVEVFRYALGYWYSEEYSVEAGEVIGDIEEIEKADYGSGSNNSGENIDEVIPDKVDFGTGVIMVDTAQVQDWSGINVLLPRNYFNFYYSYDGSSIEDMAIEQRFWATEIRDLYRDVSKAAKKDRLPFRPRGSGIEGTSPLDRQQPMMPDMMPGMMPGMPGMMPF